MISYLRELFDNASRLSGVLSDAAVATLYPGRCRVCGDMIESWRDGVACSKCWLEIEQKSLSGDFCAKCGARLQPLHPHIPSRIEAVDRRCGRCDQFTFGFARACGPYEGALRESVLRLKLHPHIPARLREALRRTFSALPESHLIESIVPVPLHPDRLAERGFNQAEVIARELISLAGLRLDSMAVIRVKKTERHRAGMGARERARSLEKAFRIRAPRLVEGRVALIVDDVMTTGSTARELAETLLDGGARNVSVLTLARAESHFIP
ncbi:MAG: ComF family protein [Blastocatellales bacterium]